MKKCLRLVHLTAACFMVSHLVSAQNELPQARIVNLNVDSRQVLVLHVRPGYVSSVRVLEEVSSVVLGDPGSFKAEHSEAEPQLVFFKATTAKPAQTNALITTKGGREISLSLISEGKSEHSEGIDYVLNFERPHSFLITAEHSSFVVGDTKDVAQEDPPAGSNSPEKLPAHQEQLAEAEGIRIPHIENPHWEGKQFRVAVGEPGETEQQMAVPFAVLNASPQTIEVLPPQVQLAGTWKGKHQKRVKAEPVAINDYWMSAQRLAPGARAEGVVLFERPSFKESNERLLLAVAQAEEVDHPALVPIPFVAPIGGGVK